MAAAGQVASNANCGTGTPHGDLAMSSCELVQIHHLASSTGGDGINRNALATLWRE